MPIATLFEQTGLSIHLADPVFWPEDRRSSGIDITDYDNYEQTIEAVGGFKSARFGFGIPEKAVGFWLDRGLAMDVLVADLSGATAWRGFVNKVGVSAGTYSVTRGPLTDVVNRMGVAYTFKDPNTSPPITVPGQTTTLADDADSQERYGIWEGWVSGGERTPAEAEQVRDSKLQDLRDPATSTKAISPVSFYVDIECLGYFAFLLAYPYADATAGTVTVQTKLGYVLDADPNGVFSVDRSHIGDNDVLAGRYEDTDMTAWGVVKGMLGLGGATDLRWTFGIYERNVAHAAELPYPIEYEGQVRSREVWTAGSGPMRPWMVRPAKWLQNIDVLTGAAMPRTLEERRRDTRFEFIEGVTYTAPFSLEHWGGRSDTSTQLLAKMGLASEGS